MRQFTSQAGVVVRAGVGDSLLETFQNVLSTTSRGTNCAFIVRSKELGMSSDVAVLIKSG